MAKRINKNSNASGLIAALQFVSIAQKEKGATFQTHCQIADNQIVAFDGVISAGHFIEEDLTACPHTRTFEKALLACGEALAITKLDNERLFVKSGKFDTHVPCVAEEMPIVTPDSPIAIIDDRIKEGFEIVGSLAKEGAERVVLASVLLRAGSMLGTNGHMIVEFWHGIDLPPNLILPKSFVVAILKSNKKLARLGFSYSNGSFNSVTFHFEDSSWIKTQLQYQNQWPITDIDNIFAAQANPLPIPEDLFKAVATLTPFSPNGHLHFFENVLRSCANLKEGSSYEVQGLPGNKIFNADYLKFIGGFATQIDFTTHNDKAYFFGSNIRGALMGCRA